MFTDRVRIRLVAGKGGNGAVAWRREKYIAKGGPTGGNGGDGGSIVLRADPTIFSLEQYRNRRHVEADCGGAGGPNRRHGRNGKNLVVKVPCGTLVREEGEVRYDLTEPGQEVTLCEGGYGGRGNDSFKTPTNRAPNRWTPGKDGQSTEVELELKLIADVGLVGFPNAGKSTLINSMTHIPVKIAAYPFTTLRPNLGYVQYSDYSRVLIADIPGLIEGAHANRGLGFEFLRHVERTKVLLFVLDASGQEGRSPVEDYRVLRQELETYDSTLAERPYIIALNKIDMPESKELLEEFRNEVELPEGALFEISAQEGDGVKAVARSLHRLVGNKPK